MRAKAYDLMCSYLSDRTLFVVAHGDTSPFTAGIPQGGIWSPILFNLYIRHLSAQINYCDLFTYADDTTLVEMIPAKNDRTAVITTDLNIMGTEVEYYFERDKCYSLCMSLKKDADLHPPLYMDVLSIAEVTMKILGIYFDRKLTWNHFIEQLTTRCCQHLGVV